MSERDETASRRWSRRAFVTSTGVSTVLWLAGCGGETAPVVLMDDELRFLPEVLTIQAGQTVTWRNTSDRMVHTATGDPALAGDPAHIVLPPGAVAWHSGLIPGQAEWGMAFTIPGEYHYICLPHEQAGMLGRLIVEP